MFSQNLTADTAVSYKDIEESSSDEYVTASSSFESIFPQRSSTPNDSSWNFFMSSIKAKQTYNSTEFPDNFSCITSTPQLRRSARLMQHNQSLQENNQPYSRCSLCNQERTPSNYIPRKRKLSRSRSKINEDPKVSTVTKRKAKKPLTPVHKVKKPRLQSRRLIL